MTCSKHTPLQTIAHICVRVRVRVRVCVWWQQVAAVSLHQLPLLCNTALVRTLRLYYLSNKIQNDFGCSTLKRNKRRTKPL